MRTRSVPVWVAGLAALTAFGAAGYTFLSAASTASLRFWYCGPSSLEHPEPACQIATKLLFASYGAALLGIGLAALAFWLHVRRLRGSNNSFKPNPLRGSA